MGTKVKKNDRITIIVPRGKTLQGVLGRNGVITGGGKKKLTSSSRPRRSEQIVRRKKPGNIKFYDLGYLKDPDTGNFSEIPYQLIVDPLTEDLTVTLADIQARDAFVFAIDNWETRAKEIKPDDNNAFYGLTMSFNFGESEVVFRHSDQFDANGFKITDEQAAKDDIQLIWHGDPELDLTSDNSGELLALKGADLIKTTLTNDFAADEAHYVPKNGDKIYIMPSLYTSFGDAQQVEFSTVNSINYFYVVESRAISLDPSSPFYHSRTAATGINNGVSLPGAYADFLQATDYAKSLPNTRNFTDGVLGGDFPDIGPDGFNASIGLSLHSPGIHGSLLMVVKRSGQTFYIWDIAS